MLYPKIDSLYERDPVTFKVIPGRFKNEAFELIKDWEWTEKIGGTNISIIYDSTIFNLEHIIVSEENSPPDSSPYSRSLIPLESRKNLLLDLKYLQRRESDYAVYGGRTENAQLPAGVVEYLDSVLDHGKLRDLFQGKPAVIFGEGYGPRIQEGGGYSATQKFIVFDICVGGFWLKRSDVEAICNTLGLDVVPFVGLFPTADAVSMVAAGFKSILGDGTVEAEGLIGRTAIPLFDGEHRRLICKLKTKDF